MNMEDINVNQTMSQIWAGSKFGWIDLKVLTLVSSYIHLKFKAVMILVPNLPLQRDTVIFIWITLLTCEKTHDRCFHSVLASWLFWKNFNVEYQWEVKELNSDPLKDLFISYIKYPRKVSIVVSKRFLGCCFVLGVLIGEKCPFSGYLH